MKISELLNEENNMSNEFDIKLILHTHFAPKVIAIRNALIKTNFNNLKINKVSSISNQINVVLKGKLPFDKQNIEEQLARVRQIVESFNKIDDTTKSEYSGNPIVYIETVPSSPIEWPNIYLNNDSEKDISLSGIGDMIKASHVLKISNTQCVSDSILGLFKIKGKVVLENITWNRKFKTSEWVSIFQKYIKAKEIIECQEELLDSGLKDYAEL